MLSGVLVILSFKWLTGLFISSLLTKKNCISRHSLLISLKFLYLSSLTNTFWNALLTKEALSNSDTIGKLFSSCKTKKAGAILSFWFFMLKI